MTDRELLAYVMGKLSGLNASDDYYGYQLKELLEELELDISTHFKKVSENKNKTVDKD